MSNTREALEQIEESLVLGFHLDEAAAEFELVCDFWDKVDGAHRAFVLFRFAGVQHFERVPGEFMKMQSVGTTFTLRKGAWVIQTVSASEVDTHKFLAISLGVNFGGLTFEYAQVTHELAQTYAVPTGTNDWAYFEVGTDRPVDFNNPFRRSWAEPR